MEKYENDMNLYVEDKQEEDIMNVVDNIMEVNLGMNDMCEGEEEEEYFPNLIQSDLAIVSHILFFFAI